MVTSRRYVSIPVYWLLVGILIAVVSPVAAFFASIQIAERNTEQIVAEQEKQRAVAAEEARKVACGFFGSSLDVYIEAPPATAAGRAQQANYLELYRLSGCQPPRTK